MEEYIKEAPGIGSVSSKNLVSVSLQVQIFAYIVSFSRLLTA